MKQSFARLPLPHSVGILLILAAIYVAVAKLGLTMAFVAEQVTVVWPATGLALGLVLLLGFRVWPAIFLGAFIANYLTKAPVPVALGIAIGNTLEALLGAWLLQRFTGIDRSLDRLRDALGLVLFGAIASTMVSATVGVTSLCLGGLQQWSSFGVLWWIWWLGDFVGDLVIAPLLLALASSHDWRYRERTKRLPEGLLLLLLLGGICLAIFTAGRPTAAAHIPLEYAIIPLVIWGALRFGQLGTSLVTFVASGIAVWGTISGHGPFASPPVDQSLVLLQSYMSVIAITGLFLSAAIEERSTADRRRAADYAVSRALAESATLAEAAPRILQSIGMSLGWDVAALWAVAPGGRELHCLHVWHDSAVEVPEFSRVTRQRTFVAGTGLPGRVWKTGKTAWIEDVVHDDNFPRAPIAARERLHGAVAFPIVLGNEIYGVIEFFSHEIRSPDGDVLDMMATVGRQIGQFLERTRASAELQESEERYRLLAERLQEADRRKDEFLATLAHELRNPLAPIRNALHLLALQKDDAPTVAESRRIMERQLQQMVRLVDDLLDVSRITRGKVELRKECVELSEVVKCALETSRPLIDASGHKLTVTLPPEPIYLDADMTRLAQVLSNVLNNAAKYTDRGGRIWLISEAVDSEAVVRIKDTGVGIPEEMLPRIFEMFTQVDSSSDRSHGGLGIGLTLVQRLVQLHGGSVEAHSEGRGKGSEFVIRLPLTAPLPCREELPKPETAPASNGSPHVRRILVVDDNKDSADSLGMLLRRLGNDVRIAHSGPAALDVAGEFLPEIVLLDIGMPGMSGYDVARHLRQQPAHSQVLIVAQSGWGQDEDRRLSKEAGFDHHLVKPIDTKTLESLLGKLERTRRPTGSSPLDS